MNKITDNLAVATNELAAALGELYIEGSVHIRDSQSYVILRKHDTDCNIEARYDSRLTSERVTDCHGNEFVPMDLMVIVTYMSHGGAEVDLAFDRATFLMECCVEARKLRDKFAPTPVFFLLLSAEDKQKLEHEKNSEVVRKAVICNCKGMRVGQFKTFTDGTFSDSLVPGTYQLVIDKKNYSAEISEAKEVLVTRK